MNRGFLRFLPLLAAAPLALVPRAAHACGGYFVSQTESPSSVSNHRMAIALSADTTTLWDQVVYVGDPADFAWILPVRGAASVGLGSPDFLDALDRNTAPNITSPFAQCDEGGPDFQSSSGCALGCGAGTDMSEASPTAGGGTQTEDGGVTVIEQETVGPYDVVEIHGTDQTSIVEWLTQNGYVIPTTIGPVLQAYVNEGFDFVALRLSPGTSVQAMQPIRVSWSGAAPSLPLRMVAAGVDSDVAIDLFVIGDGRWTTKNFPATTVDRALLVWDFATKKSDYLTQRAALNATNGGRTFVLESSIDALAVDYPSTPSPLGDAGADLDASPDGAPNVTPNETDVDVAFPGGTHRRITRLHGDLPVVALAADLELQADADQSVLPTEITVTKSTNDAKACTSTVAVVAHAAPASIGGSTANCATSERAPRWRLPLAVAGLFALGAILRRSGRR